MTDTARPDAFGRFSEDGTEYVLTDCLAPPRAQINFLWNDTLISGLNQFGSGEGIFNDRTLMLNHPDGRVQLIRLGRRYAYPRDLDSGVFWCWSAGYYPTKPAAARYRCHMGLGYSRFVLEHEGVLCDATAWLASDEPVEIWQYRLRHAAGGPRRLWLCPYVEWDLGGCPTFSSRYSYLRATYDPDRRAVVGWNTSNERPHGRYPNFASRDEFEKT